jgi:hypothetical protein
MSVVMTDLDRDRNYFYFQFLELFDGNKLVMNTWAAIGDRRP